jgi:hypothetical protein
MYLLKSAKREVILVLSLIFTYTFYPCIEMIMGDSVYFLVQMHAYFHAIINCLNAFTECYFPLKIINLCSYRYIIDFSHYTCQ